MVIIAFLIITELRFRKETISSVIFPKSSFCTSQMRAKMIVDMLFAWLRQTTDTEHDLAGKIIPLIIVQTFIDRNIMLQLGNANVPTRLTCFK